MTPFWIQNDFCGKVPSKYMQYFVISQVLLHQKNMMDILEYLYSPEIRKI